MYNNAQLAAAKKGITVPFLIALICAAVLLLSMFMPYIVSTSSSDLEYSMYEFAGEALEYADRDDEAAGFFVLVVLLSTFIGLTLLFAIIKKPIPTIIFNVFAFIFFCVINTVLDEMGTVPTSYTEYGMGYYIYMLGAAGVLAGSIWLQVARSKVRNLEIQLRNQAAYQNPYQNPYQPPYQDPYQNQPPYNG